MAVDAKYYYSGAVRSGSKFVQDILLFALMEGTDVDKGWESNFYKDKNDFKSLTYRVSGSRNVTFAIQMQQTIEHFALKTTLEKFTVNAWLKKEGVLYSGTPIPMVFEDVVIQDIKPIMQWKGLPSIHGVRLQEMGSKKLKIGTYAVTTFVKDGMANLIE